MIKTKKLRMIQSLQEKGGTLWNELFSFQFLIPYRQICPQGKAFVGPPIRLTCLCYDSCCSQSRGTYRTQKIQGSFRAKTFTHRTGTINLRRSTHPKANSLCFLVGFVFHSVFICIQRSVLGEPMAKHGPSKPSEFTCCRSIYLWRLTHRLLPEFPDFSSGGVWPSSDKEGGVLLAPIWLPRLPPGSAHSLKDKFWT